MSVVEMWTPQGLFCVFFFSSLFYLHSLAQFTETMRDAMANGDKLCRCILYLQCTYFCAMLFGSPIAMHNVKCTKTFAVHTVSAVGKLLCASRMASPKQHTSCNNSNNNIMRICGGTDKSVCRGCG